MRWLDPAGMWDQGMLELTAKGLPKIPDGDVVVVPGRYWHDRIDEVNNILAEYRWVVVVVTSDEESLFPYAELEHPNMRVWVMTPRPDSPEADRYLGHGYAPDTPWVVAGCEHDRTIDVVFAGQVTHQRRHECVAAIEALPDRTVILPTAGFTQGVERDEYLALLASSKVAPCPSGPETPDSFRVYEALEAHCVPVVDDRTPDPLYPGGYWHRVMPGFPFPAVTEWADLHKDTERILATWPAESNRCAAWWITYKRQLRSWLEADIAAVSGWVFDPPEITVLMPSSPIPSHPSTEIIEATYASVREQLDAPIVIMCDGIRPEQEDRRQAYEEYLYRLLWLADHHWSNVAVQIHDEHLHQAEMTRRALEAVESPTVLFVEHDTPLCGPIDWPACIAAVRSGRVNSVRFHHEALILEPHKYLMVDTVPIDVEGAPLLRTAQWSQRPHLASTGFYRHLMQWFPEEARTMIEDRMHGPVANDWLQRGLPGWEQWRLSLYAPDGDMKRSLHSDGRGDDPKYAMTW